MCCDHIILESSHSHFDPLVWDVTELTPSVCSASATAAYSFGMEQKAIFTL